MCDAVGILLFVRCYEEPRLTASWACCAVNHPVRELVFQDEQNALSWVVHVVALDALDLACVFYRLRLELTVENIFRLLW